MSLTHRDVATVGVGGPVGSGKTSLLTELVPRLREAGLVSCGLHCYVPDWLREHTSAMERCGA